MAKFRWLLIDEYSSVTGTNSEEYAKEAYAADAIVIDTENEEYLAGGDFDDDFEEIEEYESTAGPTEGADAEEGEDE